MVFMILKLFLSLFKLNESAGTREHPFELRKKTVFTYQCAILFINRVINNFNSTRHPTLY